MEYDKNNEMPTIKAGISEGIGVVLVIAVVLFAGAAIYFGTHYRETGTCAADDVTLRQQYEAQRSNDEIRLQAIRSDLELRQGIVKTCMDKGLIPVLVGGNVDCKAIH